MNDRKIEFAHELHPSDLLAVKHLFAVEPSEILVVCDHLDGMFGSVEILSLFLESLNDCKQLLVRYSVSALVDSYFLRYERNRM